MSPPALLIIDMQRGMAGPSAGVRNNPDAERRIADLLRAWRAAGATVVHVRHISRTAGSPFWPGQAGVEFQPELSPLATEHVVEKNVPDAFACTGLERWLHARGVTAVAVVGVSTNNSVEATARSAGNLGFKTYVASDATFAFAKVDYDGVPRTAGEVHAMALANLDGEYATVATAAELCHTIEPPAVAADRRPTAGVHG
jgi:nicotinamidase-related amidase